MRSLSRQRLCKMPLPVPVKIALRYTRRVLISFDQFLNVITGGEVAETISYRAARLRSKNVIIGCVLCRFLDLFEKDHCGKSLRWHRTDRTIGG